MAKLKENELIEKNCEMVVNDLKELREGQKITTAQLSELTGIAQPNLTRMETGQVVPNLRTIVMIAESLGATVRVVKQKEKK